MVSSVSPTSASRRHGTNFGDIEARIKHNTRDSQTNFLEDINNVHDTLPTGYIINIGPPDEGVGDITPVTVFTIMDKDDEKKHGQTTRTKK